jgi:hypothetical protein
LKLQGHATIVYDSGTPHPFVPRFQPGTKNPEKWGGEPLNPAFNYPSTSRSRAQQGEHPAHIHFSGKLKTGR